MKRVVLGILLLFVSMYSYGIVMPMPMPIISGGCGSGGCSVNPLALVIGLLSPCILYSIYRAIRWFFIETELNIFEYVFVGEYDEVSPEVHSIFYVVILGAVLIVGVILGLNYIL